MTDVPAGWQEQETKLVREFSFPDYKAVITFVNKVAKVAEELDHHPDMQVGYDKITIELSTHSVGGVTEKDYELAGRINDVAGGK